MRHIVAIIGVATLGACGPDDRSEISPTERVVAQWSVDSTPLLDVVGTVANGDFLFAYPIAATRLSGGHIVIADGFSASVRFLDATGRPVRTVGREGGGPGEFRGISWLGHCGADSVFVWDSRQGRMSVIDQHGNFVRQYHLPGRFSTVRCSRSGAFALLGFPPDIAPPPPSGESPHYRAPLRLADSQGRVTFDLGDVPALESRPLGKFTSIALSDEYLFVGTMDSGFVDVYGLNGEFIKALSVGADSRAPTVRHYEKAIDAQLAGLYRPEERRPFKDLFLKIPMPDLLPPYTALLIDPQQTLWLVMSAPGDVHTWLRAVDQDGYPMADLQLPADTKIFEVGEDYVLGAYDDDIGESHIVVYRLHR